MPIPTDPLILNSQDRRHRDQNFAVARFTRRLWFSSPLILMLTEGLSISVVSFRKGCRPWCPLSLCRSDFFSARPGTTHDDISASAKNSVAGFMTSQDPVP